MTIIMRINGLAIAAVAVALTGMLAICAVDPVSAAGPPKGCKGRNQALQNGECVSTTIENPDRAARAAEMNSYRSKNQKIQKHKKPQS